MVLGITDERLMIDLHCHSYCSDGLLSPEALLTKALSASIKILALTDHDTTMGLPALHLAAENMPIYIIDGIELSARWKLHDIHIIGLKINREHPVLKACIQRQEQSRVTRAEMIGDRLTVLGIPDTFQKATEYAGHNRVGRPHYAHVLVNEGIVKDTKSAFKRFLARGKPAYISTEWLELYEAVDVIHQAGGLAVLAHPLKYKLTRTKLNALITAFKDAGGVGLEVVSGCMLASEIIEMAGLCNRFALLASSGSDYHGDTISRIGLGQQKSLPVKCIPIWEQWALLEEGS